MVRAIAADVLEKRILPLIPAGRVGEPEEIGALRGVPGVGRGLLHHRLDADGEWRAVYGVKNGIRH